ncbi:MAG: tetratricopeptide repeat protein [Bacteroidota bacterium]|jgi:signal transduction histidine kinase
MFKQIPNKVSFLILFISSYTPVIASTAIDSLRFQVKNLSDSVYLNKAIANCYQMLDLDKESVRAVALTSIGLSKEIGYKKGEAESLNLLGRVYRRMAWYDKAISTYLMALKHYESLSDPFHVAMVCNDIAIIYMNLKDYRQVLKYGIRALDELELSAGSNGVGKVNLYNLIGAACFESGDLVSALNYFKKAQQMAENKNDAEGVAISLVNISKVHRQLGAYDLAVSCIEKSIVIRRALADKSAIAASIIAAAQIYMGQGDFKRASGYLKQAKYLTDSLHEPEITLGFYQVLGEFYKRTGKFREALHLFERVKLFEDSAATVNKSNRINELEAIYQAERRENENAILKKENALKEVDLLNAKLQQQTTVIIVVFLLIMAAFVVYTLYRKSKINQRLTKLNTEKNNIMAVLSHDLKSPFTRLHTHIQQLQTKQINTEDKFLLKNMQELVQESSDMIQNLLDVTYLEERKMNLNLSEIDLYESLSMLCDSFKNTADRKRLSIELEVNTAEFVFITDAQKFKRIADNLLSNAIKYSNHDKKIQIGVKDEKEGILLSIKDEGQGLDEADMAALFTKFSRLKSVPTGGESSTGMGLYIVKKLCNSLGGKVWCESEAGVGSVFYVWLPSLSIVNM